MNISFIFVPAHSVASEIVCMVTNSKFGHVAVQFNDCIIEADFPKVCISPVNTYDEMIGKEIITFEVSYEQYQNAYLSAKAQLCKWYGFNDCFIGGLHDLFNIHLNKLDFDNTIDCSAIGTIVAASFLKNLNDIPCEITPEDLYNILLKYQEDGVIKCIKV